MANTDFRHLNALRGTYGNLDACVNTISTQTGATIVIQTKILSQLDFLLY